METSFEKMVNANARARKESELRGIYKALTKTSYFVVTRLSEDGRQVYGYHCNAAGTPIARTPLTKVRLNLSQTAPAGFVRHG